MTRTRPRAMKATALFAATLVATAGISTWAAAPASAAEPAVERVAGADRHATSAAVSRAAYPRPVDTVVVASGTVFADGIGAGPIAAQLGAPLLLTLPAGVPGAIATELRRLAPSRIVIAGGTGAVTPAVERTLRGYADEVVRVGGVDRYATSEALVRFGFLPDAAPAPDAGSASPGDDSSPADGADAGSPAPTDAATDPPAEQPSAAPAAPRVFIATGQDFPDSLAGGALAAASDAPLVVVRGSAPQPAAATLDLLADLGTTHVTLLGGPGAVSSPYERALRAEGLRVDRLHGADRYATSGAIAGQFPRGGSSALVVTGRGFADALSAITLASVRDAPIVLSGTVCPSTALRQHVSAKQPRTLSLIGGHGVLRGLVGSMAPCLSTTAPDSLWVVVNKKNALRPTSYAPSNMQYVGGSSYRMRADAAAAYEQLAAGVRASGAGGIMVTSGTRTYASQQSLYASYVRTRGQAWADSQSARAGHSEHQTGLAVDVAACSSRGCGSIYSFDGTPQQRWIADNAWRYGFIVRYENGRTGTTGYAYEPWHLRYVGHALAADYRAGGFRTLEDYFGYPAAPRY